MDPIHRALLKAKQRGLNVAAAFKARYTGPFEALDKDGKVIPAMLSLDSVNPDTLEVVPQFDPDGKGAKIVDATGKVVLECDNITAKTMKIALNKPKTAGRDKKVQEDILCSNWEEPCNQIHYNDFNVVVARATVRCGKETVSTNVYVGEWDEGAKLPRITFSAIQAFKTWRFEVANKYCCDIIKHINECKANNDTSVLRSIKIGNLIVDVDWTSVYVALITSSWRAVVLQDGTEGNTTRRKPSRPRKRIDKTKEQPAEAAPEAVIPDVLTPESDPVNE